MIMNLYKSDVIITNILFLKYLLLSPINFSKRLFKNVLKLDSKFYVKKKLGYKFYKNNELEDTTFLINELGQFVEEKIKNLNKEEIVSLAKQKSIKPYYFNLLEKNDLVKLKSLKLILSSKKLISILKNYYGFIPHLSHIAIFNSNNDFKNLNKAISGTQHPHFDNWDLKHVKVFINLSDVGKNDGPLYVYDKEASKKFMKKTNRILRRKPVRNDEELNLIPTKPVPFVGEKGSIAIVDTSNCLHYGSRVNTRGNRLTLVLHFTCFSQYSKSITKKYQDLNLYSHNQLRKDIWPFGY